MELLKILLPGCPNAAGTQEDNEPDLIRFAEMACRMTDDVNIINVFLDHCNKINLKKDKISVFRPDLYQLVVQDTNQLSKDLLRYLRRMASI